MTTEIDTIEVKVLWGSKSSNGKWGQRAVDAIKEQGGAYNSESKTWTIPADAEFSQTIVRYIERVQS